MPSRAPVAPRPAVAPDAPSLNVERIAVLRALPGVGDLLCAVPALRAVRAAHPGARVTLVGLSEASWFVDRYAHLVDDLLVVVGVEGLPEIVPDADALAGFRTQARSRHFDLALQLHGSGVATNPLTMLLGAGHPVTAWLPGEWRPPGTTVPYPTGAHEIERLLTVTRAAGIPDAGTEVTVPLHAADHAAAGALLAEAGLPTGTPYACIHPGASRPANRWDPAGYAAVGERLAAAGLAVVLTGTVGERAVVAEVARRCHAPAVDLSGRTDVGTLAALFSSARVVVSNDTGAAHVAAAVRVPSVVVFAPDGDPVRWAPLDRERHRAVLPPTPAGGGPARRRSGRPDPATGWPSVDAVLAALDRQLAAGHSAPPHDRSASSERYAASDRPAAPHRSDRPTPSAPPASPSPSARELLR